ncbi:Syntenin-1 [Halotydeus destructor]|nr:Syntenin-1 [Halotydeus destructor]
MALYPSLEDMQVGQLMQAQSASSAPPSYIPAQQHSSYPPLYPPSAGHGPSAPSNDDQLQRTYPALFDMGLNLTPDEITMITNSQVAMPTPSHVLPFDAQPFGAQPTRAHGALVAPVSGGSLGLLRAQVTHGVREVTLCKDQKGKVGLRVQAISKGIFVVLVQKDSPAALVGLRFGDQILQIDGDNVAGYSVDKVHNILKKGPANGVKLAVRDRPFERTITLHKDSTGHIGFTYKAGKINAIVKDSSAARNGVLTDHHLLEVNGQNVVGVPDKQSLKLIEEGGAIITVTIMPSAIYEHIMKHTSTSIVKKLMDHSVPDI